MLINVKLHFNLCDEDGSWEVDTLRTVEAKSLDRSVILQGIKSELLRIFIGVFMLELEDICYYEADKKAIIFIDNTFARTECVLTYWEIL